MNYLALGDSISIDDYTEVAGGGAASQFAGLIGAREVQDLTRAPLAILEEIAARLARFRCAVIMNTIYDPTDGDDSLALEFGIPPEARAAYRAINAGIRTLARDHGFLLSDL